MITRRTIVLALGAGALTAPLASFAQQQPVKIPRIGILTEYPSPMLDGFIQGLRELGYIEGKNILLERRFTANDPEKARAYAQELVALRVDVIFARASAAVEPARRATSQIPIVFSTHNDPVGVGHAVSIARPGGNITGLTQMAGELNIKNLELIKELLPRATRVAVLSDPTVPSHVPALKGIALAGKKLALTIHFLEASSVEQVDLAFQAAAKAGDRGLLLLTSPLSLSKYEPMAVLALKYRLPVMFGGVRAAVDVGGLISYGPDLIELNRRAATYVDRILKGEKPASMAIEQPTKFELAINMKTAKTLGIKVPNSILVQATKVIE